MENDEPKQQRPISPSKLSKTPSWIMLGFVLGALFVLALPPLGNKTVAPPPSTISVERAKPAAPAEPPQLTTIEAVFEVWKDYAVWSDDTTEVVAWNAEKKAFSDIYEVRRLGGAYYFRTLPRLTRRIVTHGKPPPTECPLQFTETEEQYREWHEHGRKERPLERDWRPTQDLVPPVKPSLKINETPTPGVVAPPAMEQITPPLAPRVEPDAAPKK
jgi:hypothetical protein